MKDDRLISLNAAIDAMMKLQTEDIEAYGASIPEGFDGDRAVTALKALPPAQSVNIAKLQPNCNQVASDCASDCISRQAAVKALEETKQSDPFNRYEYQNIGIDWSIDAIKALPSAQPECTCLNCGRTANNGGWYADGRTRCPIEEHYALPKDGYCHLWEKRNVTDDDYPGRREE